MSSKQIKQIVRGYIESIKDEFVHYQLSLGNCTIAIGEEQINDVINVLLDLREIKIEKFGRIDGN